MNCNIDETDEDLKKHWAEETLTMEHNISISISITIHISFMFAYNIVGHQAQ